MISHTHEILLWIYHGPISYGFSTIRGINTENSNHWITFAKQDHWFIETDHLLGLILANLGKVLAVFSSLSFEKKTEFLHKWESTLWVSCDSTLSFKRDTLRDSQPSLRSCVFPNGFQYKSRINSHEMLFHPRHPVKSMMLSTQC